jgi:phosphoglycerate dehydrogenase-like enzyme
MPGNGETTVLFIWPPNQRLREYLTDGLSGMPGVRLVFAPDREERTLLSLAPDGDIIVGWRPTKQFLQAAKRLRLFINPGAGVQHLIEMFREVNRERPVTLVNGHGNSYFTAQHAVALLLALTNKVVQHHNWMASAQWRRGDEEAPSTPLRDRRVGLLGYGAVNRRVHRFLSAFDLEFAVLRRDWGKQDEPFPTPAKRYTDTDLHEFLDGIDTLMIAVPKTSRTEGMIGKPELELLGSDALLVNVGRGSVVDEEDLYSALKEKIIAGAAIDVWYDYSPTPDAEGRKYPFSYPFHELNNVVLSPHRAASPLNGLKRWDEVIENISRFTRGEEPLNIVDLERGY